MRSRVHRIFWTALCTLAFAAASEAVTITPIPLGDRWVHAYANICDTVNDVCVTDSQEVSSFDWSVPYDETVSASVVGALGGTITATASQQSNVTATSVVTQMNTSVAENTAGFPEETGGADGITSLSLAFTIDMDAHYVLSGVLDPGGVGIGRNAEVRLFEASGLIVIIDTTSAAGPFSFSGFLPAGMYGLSVDLNTFPIGSVDSADASAQASFVVSDVPAPRSALLLGGSLLGYALAARRRV